MNQPIVHCQPATLDGFECNGFECNALVEPTKSEVLHQIHDMTRRLSNGKFPGPNPCSLEKADLKKLVPSDNWLCEKTDGIRVLLVCLLYQGHNLAVLVTRGWDVYVCGIRNCPKVLFQASMFDGELVRRDDRWCWLGFDAIMVAGIPVWSLPLSERLAAAARGFKNYLPDARDRFVIEFKKYFRKFEEYEEYLAQVTHPVDGTIITPEDAGIVVGRHQGLLKLKDSGKHTVDFEFRHPNTLHVYDPQRRCSVQVATLTRVDGLTDGCIVEACMQGTEWVPVLIRTDKTTANDMLTYTKTLVNIKENLMLQDVRQAWMAR